MGPKSFRELRIWKETHELALVAYRVTTPFPQEERYGLVSQIRRAAVSVPTNIAEGCGRRTTGDLVHFLYIARGSLQEVGYIDAASYASAATRYAGLDMALCRSINALKQKAARR